MNQFLLVLQTIISILLVVAILLQSRGTGFGRGTTTSFTRRGVEKLVFKATFVLAALFIIVSILLIFA